MQLCNENKYLMPNTLCNSDPRNGQEISLWGCKYGILTGPETTLDRWTGVQGLEARA